MKCDFTLGKYEELCKTLLKASYVPITISEYLKDISVGSHNHSNKFVIMRHDVDRKLTSAFRMAKLEHELGIRSTYHFRYPYTFDSKIIMAIQNLGHEVGYHYETLSKANGDQQMAICLFEQELAEFRAIPGCKVTSISMHGKSLSPYDNRDMWKKHDYRKFGLLGEAYLSMTEEDILYLTDTGRSWDGKNSVRDAVPGAIASSLENVSLKTTNDLINYVGSSKGSSKLYINTHPGRWSSTATEWTFTYLRDHLVNFVKMSINRYRMAKLCRIAQE